MLMIDYLLISKEIDRNLDCSYKWVDHKDNIHNNNPISSFFLFIKM